MSDLMLDAARKPSSKGSGEESAPGSGFISDSGIKAVVNCPVPTWGGALTAPDYSMLEKSWINRDLAGQALLRRVTSSDGAFIVGRRDNNSYGGIIFPYIWPGENHIREYWLRRDAPEIQYDSEGHPKEKNKYMGPPGRGNLVYFVPGTSKDLLHDTRVPIAITEGAKKTISLHRLSWYGIKNGDPPRYLPIGLAGVWNWMGVIGKGPGPDGSRRDEKGVIPDFERISWSGRPVYIVFDLNVNTNTSVNAARRKLSSELRRRGSVVLWVNLPATHRRAQ
jgi:hypothetical protein